jgi:hypothetical protein
MGKSKGTDIICLRKSLQDAGEKTEQRFLNQLTVGEIELYDKMLSSMWIPIEVATKFLCLGSMALYPQETQSQALFKQGYHQAYDDINKICRLFFKVLSVRSYVNKMPFLWRGYNDTGKGCIEFVSKKHLIFVLTEYPDYPIAQFDNIRGYIYACAEMLKAKNIQILLELTDPEVWKIHISWE